MMISFDYLVEKYSVKPNGVLHLGASTGQEAEVYHKYGIKNVIWVEAIPAVFQKLVKHVKQFPGNTCINACVSDIDGQEVQFNISNNEAQSSSIFEMGHHTVIHPGIRYIDKIKLKTSRVDSLVSSSDMTGDWLLNCDLQGAELLALKGCGELLKKFKWVYSEINKKYTYVNCPLVDDIDTYLSTFGFIRKETGNWVADTWTDGFYSK